LDIVIVNWNAGQQLRECLESISAAERQGFELSRVVVVDNASSDGSADGLSYPDLPLHLIRNQVNLGFGTACNQAANGCSADYTLFLNPDARLFASSLDLPILFMERPGNARVGICGIQLMNDRGEVSRTCARFPRPLTFLSKMLGLDRVCPRLFPDLFLSEWGHDESREVDHVMGAFFLVRSNTFQSLGGFDERFFVYLEDLDFSLRAHQAGWKSFYLAEAQAYHKSGGTSQQVKARRLFYFLHSRVLYGYKHFGALAATGLLLATLLVEPWMRLVKAGATFSPAAIADILKAYAMLWISLGTVLPAAFRKDFP
jgi:GT2 family glycosyltransferase